MSLQATATPIIAPKTPYGPGIGDAPRELRSKGFQQSAVALEGLLQRVNALDSAARGSTPSIREILVTDAAGKVIGAIGEFIFQGVRTTNYFSEIHVGDPLGTGDPSQALFNANTDGSVTIGQHGWLDVLDPYDGDAAWIGTQYDTQAVTGAIASPTTPLIRLTVTGHTLATGDVVRVLDVGGVPNATGIRTVTKINANTIDLQSTVFVGTYTSGGTVDRLMHVTGAVNNGSGLIRLTVTAHAYESGDKVNVATVGGVTAATGQWIITVITANTFDLVGSTFAGTYTSGGTCLRYFAGGLFQTIAVGPSFVNYKLRAFADGTLKIKDAEIILTGAGGVITFDPSIPAITVADNDSNVWATLEVLNESPLTITAATNTSPSVLTHAAHGYVNGDTVVVAGALGNTAINGYRIVQGVTLNTFTMTNLAGTAINGNGVYTASSGTATRYYGGGLFSSIAIGESFSNYKLRAFADGSLSILDAEITLTGTTSQIILDPSTGTLTVQEIGGGGPPFNRVEITSGQILLTQAGAGAGTQSTTINYNDTQIIGDVALGYLIELNSATLQSNITVVGNANTVARSKQIDLFGYGSNGPLVSFSQAKGDGATPTDTLWGTFWAAAYSPGTMAFCLTWTPPPSARWPLKTSRPPHMARGSCSTLHRRPRSFASPQ